MAKKTRRKRGGQPGNQNARKHGFYSLYLSTPELRELQDYLNLGNVDRNAAVIGIKLRSALCSDSGNSRIIADASRLLIEHCRSAYKMDKEEKRAFNKFVRFVIKEAGAQLSGTNEAGLEKSVANLQDELKLYRANINQYSKTD